MRVLFIGNSHTFFNDMPQTFKLLAESAGIPTEVSMIAHGGRPLSWHLQEMVEIRFALLYGKVIDHREAALIADALKNELCDAERAIDLIEFGDRVRLENIIRNVFYLGMPKTVEIVLSEKNAEKKKDGCRRKDNLKTDE